MNATEPKFILTVGIVSTAVGIFWLLVISPFQFLCVNYQPPVNQIPSCPDDNFLLSWSWLPFLLVGMVLVVYSLIMRRTKEPTLNNEKRAAG